MKVELFLLGISPNIFLQLIKLNNAIDKAKIMEKIKQEESYVHMDFICSVHTGVPLAYILKQF